jgi:hypothetical protein
MRPRIAIVIFRPPCPLRQAPARRCGCSNAPTACRATDRYGRHGETDRRLFVLFGIAALGVLFACALWLIGGSLVGSGADTTSPVNTPAAVAQATRTAPAGAEPSPSASPAATETVEVTSTPTAASTPIATAVAPAPIATPIETAAAPPATAPPSTPLVESTPFSVRVTPTANFGGSWRLVDTVTSGAGAGQTYSFDITLTQSGTALQGGGPEIVLSGSVHGDEAVVEFRQPTTGYTGSFVWRLTGSDRASGSFVTSVPNGGVSTLIRR